MLEDPWVEVPDYVYSRTDDLPAPPDPPEEITIDFKAGDGVAVNGEPLSPAALLAELNDLGKPRHRPARPGRKPLRRHEEPRHVRDARRHHLHAAHRAIEQLTLDRGAMHLKDELMPRYAELIYNGLWFSPEREMLQVAIDHSQAKVEGIVRLKLYKGAVHVTGRKSPQILYSERVVTFEDDAGAYDQRDAEGFIKLNALRLRLLAQRDRD